jgi:hypothetical protein
MIVGRAFIKSMNVRRASVKTLAKRHLHLLRGCVARVNGAFWSSQRDQEDELLVQRPQWNSKPAAGREL